MRISDWSSDVCSSDLRLVAPGLHVVEALQRRRCGHQHRRNAAELRAHHRHVAGMVGDAVLLLEGALVLLVDDDDARSEEHTSELQSLMRISYAVFCLTKKTKNYHSNPMSRTPDQYNLDH